MCRSTKHILPDDSESVNSFFQIFSKNFKFSFLPRKARHPQGFSGDPASPGLPAGNCRQQRNSEENTEIRNIEHKSAELLRSKPEADIVGHVTSLMPVIPVRHAATLAARIILQRINPSCMNKCCMVSCIVELESWLRRFPIILCCYYLK